MTTQPATQDQHSIAPALPRIWSIEMLDDADGFDPPFPVLQVDDSIDLDTPERLRTAARQYAELSTELLRLADERDAAKPGFSSTVAAPAADEPLFTVTTSEQHGITWGSIHARDDINLGDPTALTDAADEADTLAARLRALANQPATRDAYGADTFTIRASVPAADTTPLPYWWPAGRPHPGWCDNLPHEDGDLVDDRECTAPADQVGLSLAEPIKGLKGGFWSPDWLTVDLSQHVNDRAARVWIGINESSDGRHLTPGEARELAAALRDAADQAEGAGQ